ncbi:hypothetical protein MSG28_006132 [Choristoneura fumiferana]|uniref:Uncharacterized protein n=1 Tax=Choristoneura fumiferana TaxID=7141 RepID=A0ACC0JDR2_CHOFU|nr:hypothetical protein MSG28_006132 [Choristoneura fumiferana]
MYLPPRHELRPRRPAAACAGGAARPELSDDTDPKSVLYEIYRAKHENVEVTNELSRNNLIDVLDDMPWLGKLSWLQLLVYILAVGSHTGGVLERIANGADMVQLSGDLSATLVLWQVTVLYVEIYGKRKLIKKLILNLEALWSSDDKLRLEMEEIKRQSVKSIYKWISQFYKILTCYMHFYFCLPFFATAVRHFVLKEDFAFTTIYKLKVPFQYEDNFLLYWVASMIDYGVYEIMGNN